MLQLNNVSKNYLLGKTRVPALRDVSLTIDRGELLGVVGPSGSGKSTLCNLIGLLDHPTSGSVIFGPHDVAQLADDRRAELRNSDIGFVFQSFNLIPVLSALENVMLPLQIRGERRATARMAARDLLHSVGLADHMKHRPAELSGGQRQRVAIARALVTAPSVVIADEPTANLDTATARSMVELIAALNRERGTTFILATHDIRLLASVRREITLRDGRLHADSARPRAE